MKGEMQEKVEQLNADAVCLDVVVSRAEQMRFALCLCLFNCAALQ